jgi:PAS domain S-box-containing protein
LDAAGASYLRTALTPGRSYKLLIWAIEFAAVFALYWALARLPAGTSFGSTGLATVWPPSGVGFALVLLRGSPIALALASGSFLGSFAAGQSVMFATLLGCGSGISALAGERMLQSWSDPKKSFEAVNGLFKFFFACLFPTAVIASTFSFATSVLVADVPAANTLSNWFQSWINDAAISMVVASFIFLWGSTRFSARHFILTVFIALVTVSTTLFAFGSLQGILSAPLRDLGLEIDSSALRDLLFLVVAPLAWAAVRGDCKLVAAIALAFAGSAAWSLSILTRNPLPTEPLFFVAVSLAASAAPMSLAIMFAHRRKSYEQLVAMRDGLVDELKRTQLSLEYARQQFNTLVEDVTDHVIFLIDRAGRVASWNEGASRIVGYSSDEIIGQPFAIFYRPDERRSGEPVKALESAIEKRKQKIEGWRVKKNGTPFFVTGVISAIYDQDGEFIGFSSVMKDATERRKAQEKLLEAREQLAMAQKMEAIGKLTGGIAHDFNNLLMIIGGNAQTFKRLLDPKLPKAIEAIQIAAKRGEKLTRQLLTFSRSQHLSPTVVDLTSVLCNLRTMIESSLRGNIIYKDQIEDGPIFSKVDIAELELAIVNLAVNARDAMPNGGTFSISLSKVDRAPELRGLNFDGDLAAIQVSDTGTGIPPNLLSKIFDPFFTTKDVGKGTGLGLSQVYGFAHQAGGTINVESEIGKGTRFTIYIPLCSETDLTMPAPQKDRRSNRPKVLVVDDNPDVAEVTSSLFEQLGYDTTYRDSGEKALEYLQSGAAVDLVLSDIVMPGNVDGIGLAHEILSRYPKLPIILATGYSDAAKSVPPHLHVLRKPFDSDTLTDTIQRVVQTDAA